MKLPTLHRVSSLITLLAVGAFCQNLHAGWGSIQGNNRSAPAQSAAPRPQTQVNRAPEINRAPEVNRTPEVNHAPVMNQQEPVVRTPQSHPEIQQPVVRAPESHPEVQPARDQRQVAVRTPAGEADRRRMDIGDDQRQSYYWSDYHRGMRVDSLPDGYRRFGVHGHDYFYYEGVYYDNEPSGYVVVNAPVDADIPDLPPGTETVEMNGTVYYYAAGAFYVQQADGSYVVVAPPMGVTVAELPPDAVQVAINGTAYYQADGTYYLAVMQNGVIAYLTVPQP